MNLDRYRLPESVLVGEWIELPDSDGAKFLVRLPSTANREWQRETLGLLISSGVQVDENGKVDMGAVDRHAVVAFREQRLQAFARLCVAEGPPGFDLKALTGEYWPALKTLYELAEKRAATESSEVDNAVGES